MSTRTPTPDGCLRIGGHDGNGNMGFTSHGGGIHHTALIGQSPESRSHQLGHYARAVFIHKTARIEAFVSIDAGTFRHTQVGARSWLFKHVHLGHDVVIGEDCEISTGAIIGGEVTIGDRVQVKLGAIVRPQVTIGDDALIGMGAVVLTDIPAGAVVVGNPAKIIRFKDGFDEQAQATAIRDSAGVEPADRRVA